MLVTTIGLLASPDAPIHLRVGDDRAVAAAGGDQRPETLAAVLARIGAGPIVASDDARRKLDLDRVEVLMRGAA